MRGGISMAKEKPVYYNFKNLREDTTIEKLDIEVLIVHMPNVYDNYLRIKDNSGEIITAFLKDVKERNTFYEKFSNKKKVIVECSLKSEYGFVNLKNKEEKEVTENNEIKKSKRKNKEDVISEEILTSEVIEEPKKIEETPEEKLTKEEEIKHVRKTIEQEIRESIYKNPVNLDLIKENENLELDLSEYGINNTQIFTRRVDIDKMIDSIGLDYIKNPKTTILEPTSGDGAFTTRILELRLEDLKDATLEEFLLNSLNAVSTIYSIEYELPSLEVQRNNMYTLMIKFLGNYIITDEDRELFAKKEDKWKKLVKEIIFYNIIWGATATELDSDYLIKTSPFLGKYRSNDMPIVIRKWDIKKDLKYKFTNII
jgi:hypothetical protein